MTMMPHTSRQGVFTSNTMIATLSIGDFILFQTLLSKSFIIYLKDAPCTPSSSLLMGELFIFISISISTVHSFFVSKELYA
jgi:hypothetical protein